MSKLCKVNEKKKKGENVKITEEKKYEKLIFVMGSSGRKILNKALIEWDLDNEEKKSLTSDHSFILKIKKKKKKIS